MVLNDRCISVLPAKPQYYRLVTMDSAGCLAGPASGVDAAVALFRSLSDGTRLAIVARLAHGEARVADLVEELGLAQSTVSAHVGCLRECGLVAGRPQGRQVFYSLTRPELLDLLAAAETLLAATGNAVALCPNYGTASASGSACE
jgi:ArsR family transcriptional regulator, cadmium/lead-responsive transcriptional repressor